jgi:hypothetical protein
MPCWHGTVVIKSASIPEDRWFESGLAVRFYELLLNNADVFYSMFVVIMSTGGKWIQIFKIE